MGKIMIVDGADFSENAIGKVNMPWRKIVANWWGSGTTMNFNGVITTSTSGRYWVSAPINVEGYSQLYCNYKKGDVSSLQPVHCFYSDIPTIENSASLFIGNGGTDAGQGASEEFYIDIPNGAKYVVVQDHVVSNFDGGADVFVR